MRGWAYQKRLLAPRVLHFCQKELVWECQEFSGCKCSCFNPVISPTQEHSQVTEKWAIAKPSVSGEVSETVNDIPVPGVTTRDRRIARVFS